MALLSKYIQPETLARVAHQKFEPRELVEGTLAGAHKSPFHGFAVEFASHREYTPGDDLRHLDWKVYYRHGRHFIKQYEMETNLVCHLLVDVSASMRYGDGDTQKLLFAERLAATLGYLIVEQSDRVSFTTFDTEVRNHLPPSNSLTQILNFSGLLDDTVAERKTAIGASLIDVAGRAGRRGIVIVVSDFFCDLDDLNDSLQRLRYDKHEVILLHTLHPDEADFRLPGMVRFVGLEEDERHITRPDDIRPAYLEALQEFTDRLDQICETNRCERLLCRTDQNMAETLADYLHSRSQARRRM